MKTLYWVSVALMALSIAGFWVFSELVAAGICMAAMLFYRIMDWRDEKSL